ncbi:hypothetical protein Cch01nite_41580 [Cellulomonas chitinilytica]|uniref:YCII-related domain-containing protein n=1 Tax=Cellulomonas chitinilytica TaxID=398759 RepID=A0A919P8X7_9CELL|nr:YciI family protein [Cellulomonas chitinilytica]GIG23434.1 hypothetical protein Cch01nite_41580 [Cellulomonas chitinilytica]
MTTARYLVLLHGDEHVWAARDERLRERTDEDHRIFGARCAENGHKIVGGEELQHSSTSILVRRPADGPIQVTEGPFAETAEQLGGLYLVETDDLDDLVQLVGALQRESETAEIRPVVDHSEV